MVLLELDGVAIAAEATTALAFALGTCAASAWCVS